MMKPINANEPISTSATPTSSVEREDSIWTTGVTCCGLNRGCAGAGIAASETLPAETAWPAETARSPEAE